MWHLKPTLMPVVMGALGTVKKRYKRIFKTNPWKANSNRNPEILLTSTAHILRKALSI